MRRDVISTRRDVISTRRHDDFSVISTRVM